MDKEQRELMKFILENLQEQRMALSSALAEVAAIRDALIEIGPAYDGIVTRHRARHVKAAKPILAEIVREYEKRISAARPG